MVEEEVLVEVVEVVEEEVEVVEEVVEEELEEEEVVAGVVELYRTPSCVTSIGSTIYSIDFRCWWFGCGM